VIGAIALLAASALASQGYFDIVWVIAVAAAAAIVGDNVGYWIGRMGGRSLFQGANARSDDGRADPACKTSSCVIHD
jgi:membrane protein DedA with SNARE-associated domain